MAQYQVQDPSGQAHVIEGPDDATPEQVMAQAHALIPKDPEWSDIPGNILEGLKQAPSELGNLAKGLATPWPMRAMQAAEQGGMQMAMGKAPTAAVGAIPGGPMAQGLVNTAKDWGAGQLLQGDLSGAGRQAKQNIIEHPIKSALDVATVAAPFLTPEAETVQGALDEGATRASRLAQEQSVKSLEAARGQIRQVGPEDARALGQMALDKGIVSPFTPTTLGMERQLKGQLAAAGEEIGAGRAAGDLVGGAPSAEDITQSAHADFSPAYETGRLAGRAGEFDRAMETLKNPVVEGSRMTDQGLGTFEGNAAKATEMYGQAIPEQKLAQSKESAYADLGGLISQKNNAALQKALTPDQWTRYQSALNDYSGLSDIQKFFTNKDTRELAGRGQGLGTDLYKGAKDVIGHKALATGANTFAKMLSSPAVAKALPTLVTAAKAGPAALETTHMIMQKNDPDYAEETADVHSGSPSAALGTSPQSILAQVTSNPKLAPYGPMFQEANQRGPQAVTANHFTLMQRDPAYNKAFSDVGNDQSPPMHFVPPVR